MKRAVALLLFVRVLILAAADPSAPTGDWPQWQGPDCTNVSRETGLLKEWPQNGPRRIWSISGLGSGYGSVSVMGDRVFVQGSIGQDSNVFSLNRADGRRLWSRTVGPSTNNTGSALANAWAFPGARGTPTVDGDRLYVLTESGDLSCLRVSDGSVLWHRNILKHFGGQNIPWMISESPLIDDRHVVVTPGGSGTGIVALDKLTGRTVWTSRELGDAAGHASLVAADVQGVRVLTTVTSAAAVGVRASDGKVMWRYPRVANSTANISTPIVFRDKVFYTSNYDTGAALLGLKAQGGAVTAHEIYFTRDMQNQYGGVVLVGGYVYGVSGSTLTCLEFETGTVRWRHRGVGNGSLTYADGNLYIHGEDNIVGLVEATPSGYKEHGRFRIPDEGSFSSAYPVVAHGNLFIRNQETLTVYDLRRR